MGVWDQGKWPTVVPDTVSYDVTLKGCSDMTWQNLGSFFHDVRCHMLHNSVSYDAELSEHVKGLFLYTFKNLASVLRQ